MSDSAVQQQASDERQCSRRVGWSRRNLDGRRLSGRNFRLAFALIADCLSSTCIFLYMKFCTLRTHVKQKAKYRKGHREARMGGLMKQQGA